MCQLRNACLILTADGRVRLVDACVRALVQHLNRLGIATFDSCCGHGEGYGHITILAADSERAQRLGFTVCTDTGDHRPSYPFAAVSGYVNIILDPCIRSERVTVSLTERAG